MAGGEKLGVPARSCVNRKFHKRVSRLAGEAVPETNCMGHKPSIFQEDKRRQPKTKEIQCTLT